MSKIDDEIALLQNNMEMFRKLLGWSAEQMGNRLGVTKQTILNLEHGKPVMSRIQYIAIRAVIEAEINKREDDERQNLLTVLNLVFDDNLSISAEQRQEALDAAKVMANANFASKDRTKVTKTLGGILMGLGLFGSAIPVVGLPIGVVSIATWLSTMLQDEKDK